MSSKIDSLGINPSIVRTPLHRRSFIFVVVSKAIASYVIVCSFKIGYHYYQIQQTLLILVNSWTNLQLRIQGSPSIVTNLSEGVQMVCLYPGLIFLHCCNPFWNCSGMFWSFQIRWICLVNFCFVKLTLFSHFLLISSERKRTSVRLSCYGRFDLTSAITSERYPTELNLN